MATLFDSNDWSVENAPIVSWGHNQKGTFFLVIQRAGKNGSFNWTVNIHESMVGNLPEVLDAHEHPELLKFTGGRVRGYLSFSINDD